MPRSTLEKLTGYFFFFTWPGGSSTQAHSVQSIGQQAKKRIQQYTPKAVWKVKWQVLQIKVISKNF